MAVSNLFAEMSIKDVLRSFDEKLARNSIPKAEVVIGSIHFGQTETCGSVAGWMKDEITKAAVRMRRIKIIRDTLKTVQIETKTRGLVATMKKPQSAIKKKYIITGKYIENKTKGEVSLTLYLEISEGERIEVFATETAIIKTSELKDYGLTLYPENIEEVKNIEEDFETAEAMLEDERLTNSQAVQITAFMLDSKDNVVETLKAGDVVKFLVATDKDAYIRIMGIDANGNTFWLPIKDNFILANTVRTFPDDNTLDYQVVDGVFGAEHLFIYACTSKDGLPAQDEEGKYHPSLIANTARSITAVKTNENFSTGVFKIAYTVLP